MLEEELTEVPCSVAKRRVTSDRGTLLGQVGLGPPNEGIFPVLLSLEVTEITTKV